MLELTTTLIKPEILAVLKSATAEGNKLFLPQQLDRPTYGLTDKVLKEMGGKWVGRKVMAHVFDEGVDVAALMAFVVANGCRPKVNPLSFFRSTPPVIKAIKPYLPPAASVKLALEPSCGDGALLKLLSAQYPQAKIIGVEIEADRAQACRDLRLPNAFVQQTDFLDWAQLNTMRGQVDLIGMNPPFSCTGNINLYADHISVALEFLAPGGTIIAIAPNGLRTSKVKKVAALREQLLAWGKIIPLPEDAFKASGIAMLVTLAAIATKPKG